jgi:hypothetical protein
MRQNVRFNNSIQDGDQNEAFNLTDMNLGVNA